MANLAVAARELDCPGLVSYLEGRERALLTAWEDLRGEMPSLRRLAQLLR